MVDSMKQIFLLKPEVLTPNGNGFMAKKRKWHLKAGSTVLVVLFLQKRTQTFNVRMDIYDNYSPYSTIHFFHVLINYN